MGVRIDKTWSHYQPVRGKGPSRRILHLSQFDDHPVLDTHISPNAGPAPAVNDSPPDDHRVQHANLPAKQPNLPTVLYQSSIAIGTGRPPSAYLVGPRSMTSGSPLR